MEYIQTTLFSDTDLDELRAELAKTKNEVGNILLRTPRGNIENSRLYLGGSTIVEG